MIDFHSQLSIIPEGYESATLQDNLEHSGGITLSWKAASDAEIPLGAYITYEDIRYILLEPYAPTKESAIHWHYNPTFKHPQNMLDRIPFWVKSLDASGTPVNLQTTSFTGYPETIVAKLCSFINTEYVRETSDSFFASTVGTGWRFSIPNANNEKHAIITVAFDGCSIKSAADRIGDAMGCNVFFDWSAKVIRFVVGTTIQGEVYNTFHVLGGTKNMGKTTVSGGFAAVTQRLTLPDSYKGSIISYAENNGIRLTTDLIFDEIYPKQELFIKTARQRLCYLTDNESGEFIVDHWEKDGVVVPQDTKGAKPVFKTFAKWYVTLATDRELQNDYVFNQEYLIKDKPLGLLFQIDDQQMPNLVGHEFELTYFPEAKEEYDRNDAEATAEEPFVIVAHEYYIACKAVGEMLLPTTLTDGAGLVPRVKDKVTLVNMALNDEQKGIAKRELLAAAQEIIGAMMAQKGEYTETVLNAQGIAIGGASPFTSDHGPIVTNINQNLDTGVAEVTVGSWSRKTKTGGTVDKLETVTVSASNPTEGDGGLGGNSSKTIGQTLLKPDSLFSVVLGNSMDVVSCDSDGKTKVATDVITKVTGFYGNRDVTASCAILYTSDLPAGVTIYQESSLPEVDTEDGEEPETPQWTGKRMEKDTEVALDNGSWLRIHFDEGIAFGDKLVIDFVGSHPSFSDRDVAMTIQCMRPGESRIGIDLDNDADVVSIDENGKVRFDRTVVTNAYIYEGGSIVTSGVTKPDSLTPASLKIGGCEPTISNVVDGQVTITWEFEDGVSATSAEKTVSLTYKNRTYSTTFSLVALDSASIYQLQPSLKAISFARVANDNSLTPARRDLTLSVVKFDGQGTENLDNCPAGYSVEYAYDNEINGYNDGLPWEVEESSNKFQKLTITNDTSYKYVYIALFYHSGTKYIKVDNETIPVIKDGFNGDGIVSVTRTYNISAQSTTASETTAPSDISVWLPSSPAVNEAKPYLWAREAVTYKYQSATVKFYMIGARGQNGIDAQDIEWAYIRTKTNVAPVIADDSAYTDSNSKTYTSDDHLPHVTGNSNVENNHNTYECTDDPKGVDFTWKYEWEIKREKGSADNNGHRVWVAYSGTMTLHNNLSESALVIDIDNDSDQFGVDSEGAVVTPQQKITKVTMLYGTAEQAFTSTPTATMKYDDGNSVNPNVATVAIAVVPHTDYKQYIVTVTINATGSNTPVFTKNGKNGLYVDISGTCANGTKSIRFTLEKVMSGKKGEDPVIYQLNPTSKSFSFARNETNNELTPTEKSSTINVLQTIGNNTTPITSATAGLTYSWGFEDETTATSAHSGLAIGTSVSVSNTDAAKHTHVWVKLSTGDTETLPIVKDGAHGDNSVRVDLDNENDSMLYNGSGTLVSGQVTSTARLYDGSEDKSTSATWTVTASGCTISSGNSRSIVVTGMTAATGTVTVSASYRDAHGNTHNKSAVLTLKKITDGDKYDLEITPNSVAYNVTTNNPPTSTIAINVYRTYINSSGGVTRELSAPPSGYSVYAGSTPLTASSTGKYSTTTNNSAISELVVKIAKSATSADILDVETIPINKAENGSNGDSPASCFRWYNSTILSVGTPTNDNSAQPAASDYKNDSTKAQPTTYWSKNAPNRPASGEWNLWMSSSVKHTAKSGTTTYDNWSSPVRISGDKGDAGEDSKEREWIYRGSTTQSTPTGYDSKEGTANGQAISGKTGNDWNADLTDDFVPTNWSDNAIATDDTTNKFVYASWRDWNKTTGKWGDFNTPILWSNWGRQGIDGDGVQYIYKLFANELTDAQRTSEIPDNATFNSTTGEWMPSDTSGKNSGWYDEPQATTQSTPFCYCSVIKKINGAWETLSTGKGKFGKLGLWSKWSADGTSPYFADIDNEMESVACDKDGKTTSAFDKTVNVSMWHGSTPMALTKLETSSVTGITITPNKMAKTIRFQVSSGTSISETNNVTITVACEGSGDKTLHFVLNGVRAGADGQPAVLYSLVPSVSSVVKKKDGTYSVSNVSCTRQKNVGGTITDNIPDGAISYKLDGGSEQLYTNNTNIAVTNFTKSIQFIFKVSSKVVDIETIPMVADGIDGTSPWVADLDNESDGVVCDDTGYVLAKTDGTQQSVSTVVSLYYGKTLSAFGTPTVTRNRTSMTVGSTTGGVTIGWDSSSRTLTVSYATSVKINGKDDIAISIQATNDSSVKRTLHFIVLASTGDVYNLLPAVSEIVAQRNEDGTYTVNGSSSYTVECKYTKRGISGNVEEGEIDSKGVVDGKYYVFLGYRRRSDQKWWRWNSSTNRQTFDETDSSGNPNPLLWTRFTGDDKIVNINTYDTISLMLSVEGASHEGGYAPVIPNAIDRETISVVANGADGDNGISGISLKKHDIFFARNNSSTSAPTSGWGTNFLTPTKDNRYTWRKDVYEYDAPDYGRNLIVNSDNLDVNQSYDSTSRANGKVYKSGRATGSVVRVTDQPWPFGDVTNCIKVVNTSGSGGIGFAQGELTLHDGPMKMSCWIKCESGTASVQLQIAFNQVTEKSYALKTIQATTEWQKFEVSGTVAEGRDRYCIGYVYNYTNGTTIYVAGLKVEYGDTATEWNKAPEDYNHTDVYICSVYGESSVRIDLDNQADMVSVDTNGKVRFDHTVTVNAKIYDGSTPVTSNDKITHSMTATSLKIGSRNAETPTKSGGCVTVQWKFKKGDTVSATPVTITLRYNSVDYSAVFTLGTTDSEAFYQLLPSRDSINFTRQADGSLTPDIIYPYCGYVKYTGSGAESHPLQYNVEQSEIFNFDNSGYAIWFRRMNADGTVYIWDASTSPYGWVWMDSMSTRRIENNTSFSAIQFCIGPANSDRTKWSDADIIDLETIPIVKDGANGVNGTSPWIADLDNEMDSVSCDDSGYVNTDSFVRVSTNIGLYYGNSQKAIKYSTSTSGNYKTVTSVTVKRNGTTIPLNAFDALENKITDNVYLILASNYKTISVAYLSGAKITGKDDFEITIIAADDQSVQRTLHFTVNGIIGDVYNLLPSVNEIIANRKADGTYTVNGSSSCTVECKYTKRGISGNVVEGEIDSNGVVDGKYYVFICFRRRSDQKWRRWNSSTNSPTFDETDASGNPLPLLWNRYRGSYKTLYVTSYDMVALMMTMYGASSLDGYAPSVIDAIDRETVYVVSNGSIPSYIQTQEAWSNQPVATSTGPTDCNESDWKNSTPENTGNKAYLWRRSRQMTLNADGISYTAGTWTYIRLNGTNGTSINVKGSVKYVKDSSSSFPTSGVSTNDLAIVKTQAQLYKYNSSWSKSGPTAVDGDSYTNDDDRHLWMWSTEANSGNGSWIDLGEFKGESGKTYYTHVAWAKGITKGQQTARKPGQTNTPNASDIGKDANNNPYFSISPMDGYDWMGILIDTDVNDASGTNAWKYYTWSYVKGANGTNGENSIRLALDNEHEDFVYNDANERKSAIVTSQIRLYDGHTQKTYNTDFTATIDTNQSSGISTNSSASNYAFITNSGVLTINGINTETAVVVVTSSYSGGTYYAKFTANRINQDKYDLVVRPNAIAFNSSVAWTDKTISLSADRTDLQGNVTKGVTISTTANSGNLRLFRGYVKSDGKVYKISSTSTEGVDRMTAVSHTVKSTEGNSYIGIYFELRYYTSSSTSDSSTTGYRVCDYETVEIAKSANGENGTNGENSIRLALDNQHEDFKYNDNGDLIAPTSGATSVIRLYDGETEVTNFTLKISAASGCTPSTSTSVADRAYISEKVLYVKGISQGSQSAWVRVMAYYNGEYYYAKFTANKTSGDKYDLFVTPSSIAYNSATYATQTISFEAKGTDDTGNQYDVTITSGSASLVAGNFYIFYGYVQSDGRIVKPSNPSSRGVEQLTTKDANNKVIFTASPDIASAYVGIYFVLRKYSSSTYYRVCDYETVEIAKSANGTNGTNGTNGDSYNLQASPDTLIYDTQSLPVAFVGGNSFNIRATHNGAAYSNSGAGALRVLGVKADGTSSSSYIYEGSITTSGVTVTADTQYVRYDAWLTTGNVIVARCSVRITGNGARGQDGIQGCVVRVSEWKSGTVYRNDEGNANVSVGYIDVAAVADNSTYGYAFYRCKQTHTSSSSITTESTTYWELQTDVGPIFTSLLVAKNAYIKFGTGNQFVITDDYNNIRAGLKGSGSIRMWAGGDNITNSADRSIKDVPFRVFNDGSVVMTQATIEGDVKATKTNGNNTTSIEMKPGTSTAELIGKTSDTEVINLGFDNNNGYLKLTSQSGLNYTEVTNSEYGGYQRNGVRIVTASNRSVFLGMSGDKFIIRCTTTDQTPVGRTDVWLTSNNANKGDVYMDTDGTLKVKLT